MLIPGKYALSLARVIFYTCMITIIATAVYKYAYGESEIIDIEVYVEPIERHKLSIPSEGPY